MKKHLLLITGGFPFGEIERGFLPIEFQRLTGEFQVSVLSWCGRDVPLLYSFPSDIPVRRVKSIWQDPKSLLWLLTVPFRPFVVWEIFQAVRREVLQAVRDCTVKTALLRIHSIVLYYFSALRNVPLLRRIVKEDKIDLIYTYWCLVPTLAAVLLKKYVPELKVITRFHGYDLYRERSPIGLQPFRQEISHGCDLLIFAAEMGKKYYLETWGTCWASKSFVSYLGSRALSVVSPRTQKNSLTLVSCSNMIPLKRIHLIVDALRLLPEDVCVYWHHIGDGESRAALTEQAETALNPLPNVQWKFWGFVPNGALDRLYQEIQPDIFITTTSTEGGVPVSIQEVFSVSVPAIATAVGGVPEIVRDGETGFLLLADPSAQETAGAIQRFYELNAAEKKAMSEAARALWTEKFDAKKNAVSLVEQIKNSCGYLNEKGARII